MYIVINGHRMFDIGSNKLMQKFLKEEKEYDQDDLRNLYNKIETEVKEFSLKVNKDMAKLTMEQIASHGQKIISYYELMGIMNFLEHATITNKVTVEK